MAFKVHILGMNASSVISVKCAGTILIALLLSGCQREAKITVLQSGSTIQFTVEEKNGVAACVDKIRVTDPVENTTMWSVSRTMAAAQNGRCGHQFRYGAETENYETIGNAGPLSPGKNYEVSISGNGYMDSRTTFTVTP